MPTWLELLFIGQNPLLHCVHPALLWRSDSVPFQGASSRVFFPSISEREEAAKSGNNSETIKLFMYRKAEFWAYEKEYRLLKFSINENDFSEFEENNRYLSIQSAMIKAVYFGAQMKKETKLIIEKFLQKIGFDKIELYEIFLSKEGFKLEVRPYNNQA